MTSEDKLKVAAQEGDISGLYRLVQEDPRVLENVDLLPFVETPLHVVASVEVENLPVEHLQFAIEIMRLKPSFAWKLDPQGFAPIHLALKKGHNRMVLDLVSINKDLVRVKGREGLTPLHFASQTGDMELLNKFFEACPESINDVTVRNETALHLAVKYQKLETLKLLIKWLEMNVELEESILNWKDEDGNTVLHIAASNNEIKAMAMLMKFSMDLDAKNLDDKTALDIASQGTKSKTLLQEAGTMFMIFRKIDKKISWVRIWAFRMFRLKQHISDDERNMYLVVATLVATATYQVALSPPGGLYQSEAGTDHRNNNTAALSYVGFNFPRGFNFSSTINSRSNVGNEGNSIMSDKDFITFSLMNMFCFMASTMVTFFLLPRTIALIPLFLTIVILQWSYYYSMAVISPTPLTCGVVSGIYLVMGTFFLEVTCLPTAYNIFFKLIYLKKYLK